MGKLLIEKGIIIEKPRTVVFNYLKRLRHQDEYSVWNMKDLNKKVETKGTDGTVGFVYSWDSQDKKVGAGSQEIKKIIEGERIESEVRFLKPMKSIANVIFDVKDSGQHATEVVWSFQGNTKFPMSLFSGYIKKALGKDIEEGLANLSFKKQYD